MGAVGIVSLAVLTWNQIGIWHDSVSLWTRALAIDARCAFAWNNLGVCLAAEGDPAGAVNAHQRALEVGGPAADTLGRLGVAYARVGRLGDAESAYRQAIDVSPRDTSAYINFADLCASQERIDEAESLLRQAIGIEPANAIALTGLANLQFRERGDAASAEANYRAALQVRPDAADAAFQLGLLLLGQGRGAEAIAVWSNAIEYTPDDVGLLVNLSLLLSTGPDAALRDPPRAYALADRARRLHDPPAARALLALGEAAVAMGRVSEGIDWLASARSAAAAEGDDGLTQQIDRKLAEYRSAVGGKR